MNTPGNVGRASGLSKTPTEPLGRTTVPGNSATGVTPVVLWLALLLSTLILQPATASAQYSIDWFTIDGGGGGATSSGGAYTITGTIGQPDAGTMSGGNYSLAGGFWSLIAAVQTPGSPTLTVAHSGNSVVISWPYPSSGFTLQQNSNLANSSGWSTYGGTVSTNNGVNSISIAPPVGSLFFRLYHP